MQNNNAQEAKPIYKELNAKRTQGEWSFYHLDTPDAKFVMCKSPNAETFDKVIAEISLTNKDKESTANAEYITLSVNNFQSVCELLEYFIKEIENTPDDLSDSLLGLIKLKSQQVLNNIK